MLSPRGCGAQEDAEPNADDEPKAPVENVMGARHMQAQKRCASDETEALQAEHGDSCRNCAPDGDVEVLAGGCGGWKGPALAA
ncbi:hypothetical protein P3T76_009663 [Phytophthora citrophthora]|uniref:Uncharacterized protein n=1 Tax=Phytophthora citrophthora TaxID=4793 RepID=A0AAD9LIW1_9STRA|nr:hypothetical protein P3T76_009663 [Phytophthora citrophthora]